MSVTIKALPPPVSYCFGDTLARKDISFSPHHRPRLFTLNFFASTTVVTPAGVIKFLQVFSAAGIISERFRACQKTETLSTLVLV